MKKSSQGSADKNRSKSKNGKDANGTIVDCAAHNCKAVSSCNSANKAVQEIERYTKEAENLVEALSALTRLAEQLKPCIATKSQCSQNVSYYNDGASEASSIDDDKNVPNKESEESADGPVLREKAHVVAQVRSEPNRVKTTGEETAVYNLCQCSSLQQNKIKKQVDDEKTGCCVKRKEKSTDDDAKSCCCGKRREKKTEAKSSCCCRKKEKPAVQAETSCCSCKKNDTSDEKKRKSKDEKVTVYPTVPATTTKAAMNLDDKEMQAGGGEVNAEVASMTEPVQILQKECATCCPVDCARARTSDVGTEKGAITLNAVPFEEYAEKDCYQYWYEDASNCKCTSTDPKAAPPPANNPPAASNVPAPTAAPPQPPPPPLSQPQPQPYYPQEPPQGLQYGGGVSSMMDCYQYYHGGQGVQAMLQQRGMQYPMGRNEDENYGPRPMMYNDPLAAGLNAVNYNPPGGMAYKTCKQKGSLLDSQHQQDYEDIECIPSCQSRGAGAPSTTSSTGPSINQSEYRPPLPSSKKIVQYEDQQQYDYYVSQTQQNYKCPHQQQAQYSNEPCAPCYANALQRNAISGRQEDRSSFGQQGGMQRGAYQRQVNNMISQPYNTLFVGKADKDWKESVRKSERDPPSGSGAYDGQSNQCSSSCPYQSKTTKRK